MSQYTLTPAKDSIKPERVAVINDTTPTADMVEYGLRDCGLESEYHLANRLQELRRAFLYVLMNMQSEGYLPTGSDLKLIDVEVEVLAKKRLTL